MILNSINNNYFDNFNIDTNSIIYRSDTDGFTTVNYNNGGILMVDEYNKLCFDYPTIQSLCQNYTENSIVVTNNNNLKCVTDESSTENKLLKKINNEWKIVDFTIANLFADIGAEANMINLLYQYNSEYGCINIPKDGLTNQYYYISYIEAENVFDIQNPNETSLNYYDGTSRIFFKYIPAIVDNYIRFNKKSECCIYSSNISELFYGNEDINNIYVENNIPLSLLQRANYITLNCIIKCKYDNPFLRIYIGNNISKTILIDCSLSDFGKINDYYYFYVNTKYFLKNYNRTIYSNGFNIYIYLYMLGDDTGYDPINSALFYYDWDEVEIDDNIIMYYKFCSITFTTT